MEYDTSTAKGAPISPISGTAPNDGRANARIASAAADVSVLSEPITFAFSGRTAKNRLLKAPMTERLCQWNKEGEDIVSSVQYLEDDSQLMIYLVCSRSPNSGVSESV